jgi:hypothetical protein
VQPDPEWRATVTAALRRILGLGLVLAVAVLVVVVIVRPASGAPKTAISSSDQTTFTTAVRRTLSSQTQLDGSLGFAGNYAVVNQAQGTLTALPQIGTVITQGDALYQVDGKPIVLLYGATPAYRSLFNAAGIAGGDVAQLNADLVALGYATGAQIPINSDEYGWQTEMAVKRLQEHLGLPHDGVLAFGQAIFLPSAVRITELSAGLGEPAQAGQPIMTGTTTNRQVTVILDAGRQSTVKTGDPVSITLPNGDATPGTVSTVGTVATTPSGDSGTTSPTITVDIDLTNPAVAGNLDQAPVEVSLTTATVKNALVVPVDSLLALPGRGYAVEIITTTGSGRRRLVPVSLGLFDDADGLVQVTNTQLVPGEHVVVPTP